ncbi:VanW family protein [Polyangium sp. 15x6]|uniref:VanW family protein n=1 Tax=Polyangium sp. 15x6 TaxID=3042687 RepID=UPI002499EA65|nr:VanW family protein [Polyangium sp. 15x6]MDI3289327.1 VanW family protein [Polyangium sp. 15x6]
MRKSSLLLVLGIGTSVAAGLGLGAYRYGPRSPVVEGLFLGEQRVPDEGSPASWLARRQLDALGWEVRFHHDSEIVETTLGAVGVEIDVQASLDRAGEVGHTGSLVRRMREARLARRGQVFVPLSFWIDEAKARRFLESIASRFAVAPVDAVLDLENKRRIEDVPGRELDIDATLAEMRAASFEDGVVIPLVTRRVPAKVTALDLAQVDVTKVVSSFETSFSLFGSGAGRAVNIRNAARKIDGIVLPPGVGFSFNDRVGARTRENGFTLAPEIQGDELTDGIGGGTCQLSSTLHGAAVYGGLEVLHRQGHSRASSYTKLGLDATVSFPIVDLKLKNPYPFPVMIHAYFPQPNKVRVEVLGGEPVAKVEYGYGVGQSYDFVRRITVKSHLPPGKRIHRQKGVRGYDVTSTLRISYVDGRVEERRWFSGYRPSPEVYWVAPGYDEANLPPLPDHAKGIEGRLSEDATGTATASFPVASPAPAQAPAP